MKICMAVYVFGDYTRYIPYYVYSVLKSYLDYYVKVFTKDSLSPNEKKCMALILDQVSPNFEVIENYFDESLHLEKPTKMVGGIETTFRFLLPYEAFKKFKFAYIGDVDFLIIRETPALINGHKKHSIKIDVTYSKAVRAHTTRIIRLDFIVEKDN